MEGAAHMAARDRQDFTIMSVKRNPVQAIRSRIRSAENARASHQGTSVHLRILHALEGFVEPADAEQE
jgi:hypothetical protein